ARRARVASGHGRAPLLCLPTPAAGRARARVVRLVRRQRELPESRRPSPRGDASPGRSDPRRDRLAVPRAAAGAWQGERTGVRRAHARRARAGARGGAGRARAADRGERDRMLRTVKKQFGQHFLADPNILGVIERLAELGPGDVVLEIGPGEGVLTRYLAERVSHVHAVEIDRGLEPELRDLAPNVD